MTRSAVTAMLLEGATLFQRYLWSGCAQQLDKARALIAKARREMPHASPDVWCSACQRSHRSWFATGISQAGRLHALCSRSCVLWWTDQGLGEVRVGYGREWQDDVPGRRAA